MVVTMSEEGGRTWMVGENEAFCFNGIEFKLRLDILGNTSERCWDFNLDGVGPN